MSALNTAAQSGAPHEGGAGLEIDVPGQALPICDVPPTPRSVALTTQENALLVRLTEGNAPSLSGLINHTTSLGLAAVSGKKFDSKAALYDALAEGGVAGYMLGRSANAQEAEEVQNIPGVDVVRAHMLAAMRHLVQVQELHNVDAPAPPPGQAVHFLKVVTPAFFVAKSRLVTTADGMFTVRSVPHGVYSMAVSSNRVSVPSNALQIVGVPGTIGDSARRLAQACSQEIAPWPDASGKKSLLEAARRLAEQKGLDPALIEPGPKGWRPATLKPGEAAPVDIDYVVRHNAQVGGADPVVLRWLASYIPGLFPAALAIAKTHVVTNGALSGTFARFAKTGVRAPVPVEVPANLGPVGEAEFRRRVDQAVAMGDPEPEHPTVRSTLATHPYRLDSDGQVITAAPIERELYKLLFEPLVRAFRAASSRSAEDILRVGQTYRLAPHTSVGQPARLPGRDPKMDVSPREERIAFQQHAFEGYVGITLERCAALRNGFKADEIMRPTYEQTLSSIAGVVAAVPPLGVAELKQKHDVTKGVFVRAADGSGSEVRTLKNPRNYTVYPLFQRFLGHAGTELLKESLVTCERAKLDSLTAAEFRRLAPWGPTALGAGNFHAVLAIAEAYAIAVVTGERYPVTGQLTDGGAGLEGHSDPLLRAPYFRTSTLDAEGEPVRGCCREGAEPVPGSHSSVVHVTFAIGDDALSALFEWDHPFSLHVSQPEYGAVDPSTQRRRFLPCACGGSYPRLPGNFEERFQAAKEIVRTLSALGPQDGVAGSLNLRPDRMYLVGQDASQYDSTQPPLAEFYRRTVLEAADVAAAEVLDANRQAGRPSVNAMQSIGVAAALVSHTFTTLTSPAKLALPMGVNPPVIYAGGTRSGGQGLTESNSILSVACANQSFHVAADIYAHGIGGGGYAVAAASTEEHPEPVLDDKFAMGVTGSNPFVPAAAASAPGQRVAVRTVPPPGGWSLMRILCVAERHLAMRLGIVFAIDGAGVCPPPSQLAVFCDPPPCSDPVPSAAVSTTADAEVSGELVSGMAFAGSSVRVVRVGSTFTYVLALSTKRCLRALVMDKSASRTPDDGPTPGPSVVRALKVTCIYLLGLALVQGSQELVTMARKGVRGLDAHQDYAEELEEGVLEPDFLPAYVPTPEAVFRYWAGKGTLRGDPNAASTGQAYEALMDASALAEGADPVLGGEVTSALAHLSFKDGPLVSECAVASVDEVCQRAVSVAASLSAARRAEKGLAGQPAEAAALVAPVRYMRALIPVLRPEQLAVASLLLAPTLRGVREDKAPRSLSVRLAVSRLAAAYAQDPSVFNRDFETTVLLESGEYRLQGSAPAEPARPAESASALPKHPLPPSRSLAKPLGASEAREIVQKVQRESGLVLEVKTGTRTVGRVETTMATSNARVTPVERYRVPTVDRYLSITTPGAAAAMPVFPSPIASAAVAHALIFKNDGPLSPAELWEKLGTYRPLGHPPSTVHDLIQAFGFKALYIKVVGGRETMSPLSYSGPLLEEYVAVRSAALEYLTDRQVHEVTYVPIRPAKLSSLSPEELREAQLRQQARQKREAREREMLRGAKAAVAKAKLEAFQGVGKTKKGKAGKGFAGRKHKHAEDS